MGNLYQPIKGDWEGKLEKKTYDEFSQVVNNNKNT